MSRVVVLRRSARLAATTTVLVLTAGLVAAPAQAQRIPSPRDARLLWSPFITRSHARALDGATVRGPAAVFVASDPDITSVRYYLDDLSFGKARQIEDHEPFDFAGTAPSGFAQRFDMRQLRPGRHTISIVVRYRDGDVRVTSASFQVTHGAYGAREVSAAGDRFRWTAAAPAPMNRAEAQGAVVGSKLYVFGGFYNGSTTRVDVYDQRTNRWTRTTDMPEGLTHAGTAVVGTDVYLAGAYIGVSDGGHPRHFSSRRVWKFDTVTATWSSMPALPAARGAGALVALGRTLHFFGGSDSRRIDSPSHWVLSLDGGARPAGSGPGGWTSATPLPQPRTHLGAVVLGGRIYAIGGQAGTSDSNALAAVHAWDPARPGAWHRLRDLRRPLSHHAAATFVLGDRIVVAGGMTKHAAIVDTVSSYDPRRDRWSDLAPLPAPRYSGVAGVVNGRIVFTTGSAEATTWIATRAAPWA